MLDKNKLRVWVVLAETSKHGELAIKAFDNFDAFCKFTREAKEKGYKTYWRRRVDLQDP